MKRKLFKQVEELYHQALKHSPEQRTDFLNHACGSDESLRKEVASLLEQAGRPEFEEFMERPAAGQLSLDAFLDVDSDLGTTYMQTMALQPGTSLGPFQIVAQLGAGGMGEVYKAKDTRLERTVAIKVLPEHLALDPERRRRFEREAKAISKLNHPHICTLYDVGELNDTSFLVMEHLEGETIGDRLAREGPLLVDDVVRFGCEIASALDKAHQLKIIHRDLKPKNVMLTDSGAKVLDFGIATRVADPAVESLAHSATSLTGVGGIVGTVPYMSPEALRGEQVDARSDVWSLGVLLYEMLGGRRPFTGASGVDVASAIMRDPPTPLPASVPEGLRAILLRCLAKDPAQRYQHAGEVRAALQTASTRSAPPTQARSLRSRLSAPLTLPRRGVVPLAGTAVVVSLFAGWTLFGGPGGVPSNDVPVAPATVTSLAVLPLDNRSGDAEQDYLSEGLTDALIAELSKIQALRVSSGTSVRRFQGSPEPVSQIAETLGVDSIVRGTVIVAGDRIQVATELIDGATGQHRWTESFDRDRANVLDLQSDIARAIAAEVRVAVTAEEVASLDAARSVNRQAYEAYLIGRYHALRWPRELPQAVDAFETAIAVDPGYAPAYAGLSISYTLMGFYGVPAIGASVLPGPQRLPRAKELAERALAFDDSLAEAHVASALVRMTYEWDWAGARAAFDRALALNPEDTFARTWYAVYLSWIEGRTAQAVAFARETLQRDPLSLDLNTRLAMMLYYDRQFDEAIEISQRVIERDPNFSDAMIWLTDSLAHVGRIAEVEAMGRDPRASMIGLVIAGRAEEARAFVRAGLSDPVSAGYHGRVSGYDGGFAYSILGDLDRAFAALNDFEDRHPYMSMIRVDPRMDLLRDDPRWDELLRRMAFPGL